MNGDVEALAFSTDGDKLFSHGGVYHMLQFLAFAKYMYMYIFSLPLGGWVKYFG